MKLSALLFRHRRWASPVATLLLVAVLAGVFALPYQYKFNQYQQGIRTLSPRIERMLGLMSVGSDMEQRQQAYAKALDVLAYPPHQNVEAMQNDLSTRLRQSVDGSGLTLGSLTPLPIKPQDGLDGYPVALNVQGSLLQLQTFLQGLSQPPRLLVDSLTVRPSRPMGDGVQAINAEITVIALRRGRI